MSDPYQLRLFEVPVCQESLQTDIKNMEKLIINKVNSLSLQELQHTCTIKQECEDKVDHMLSDLRMEQTIREIAITILTFIVSIHKDISFILSSIQENINKASQKDLNCPMYWFNYITRYIDEK